MPRTEGERNSLELGYHDKVQEVQRNVRLDKRKLSLHRPGRTCRKWQFFDSFMRGITVGFSSVMIILNRITCDEVLPLVDKPEHSSCCHQYGQVK